ncbi:hypothetical protein C8R47DRAFT_1326468 [Mycena vitilis]|nr:hypothetical protein C8R47DRAFT_1326468 [Mycena vitilis]
MLPRDDVSPSRERGFLAALFSKIFGRRQAHVRPPSAMRRVPPLISLAGIAGVPRRRRAAAPTSKFVFGLPASRVLLHGSRRLEPQFSVCYCSAELGAGGGGVAQRRRSRDPGLLCKAAPQLKIRFFSIPRAANPHALKTHKTPPAAPRCLGSFYACGAFGEVSSWFETYLQLDATGNPSRINKFLTTQLTS